ncbi:hypothetical protein [Niallia sp. 03133]|uniref:hypothetical protein n=1 Tax=Niallia sp. 03133 TaxID=3458060 RepID=UPI00404504B2
MAGKVELVCDSKAMIGEGPCWDHRTGILYWVDIEGEKCFFFMLKIEKILSWSPLGRFKNFEMESKYWA